MDAQRWAVIESLFQAALSKEPAERSSYVALACTDDPSLKAEVESLLNRAGATLSLPVYPLPLEKLWDEIGRDVPIPQPIPATVGRYRIIALLGEGGMGTVYEAEQEHPHRTVALKVIKPGLAGPESLRRFEQECQALARLQHPGIAQIYEAATADTGSGPQPYFAMEFIRGESLLQYAQSHRLNTQQRLELMAKVCEAVQHAHQRGIIHRDLKPSNILVDESGQPKILDFGVARVSGNDTQITRQTNLGQLVGTLEYMSPEQVLADPLEIDTRSDVYALGVILFELLAGRLPYNISGQIWEAARTIREEEPTRLSFINRAYRGDIQTIVCKALEKEKIRRYASAAELEADIQRYLRDEPIAARPPTTSYQLRKFVVRHKGLVAAVTALFVVLLAGVIVSTRESILARRAEQAAIRQRDRATAAEQRANKERDQAVAAQKSAILGRDEALWAQSQVMLGRVLTFEPSLERTYRRFWRLDVLQRQLELSLKIQRHTLGEADKDTLTTMDGLAGLYEYEGQFSRAEAIYANALEARKRLLGEENPETLLSMHELALLYLRQGKYEQAEPLCTKIFQVQRHLSGDQDPETLRSLSELASLYRNEGKHAQAETLYNRGLEIGRHSKSVNDQGTLIIMEQLATLYQSEKRFQEAEALLTQVLQARRKTEGEKGISTLQAENELAILYAKERKNSKAETLFTEVLDGQRREAGEQSTMTLTTMNDLASLYLVNERTLPQAEAVLEKALEIYAQMDIDARTGARQQYMRTLRSMNYLARQYRDLAKDDRAEVILRNELKSQEKTRIMADPDIRTECQNLLRAALEGQHKTSTASR